MINQNKPTTKKTIFRKLSKKGSKNSRDFWLSSIHRRTFRKFTVFIAFLYWLGKAKIVCLLVPTLNDIFPLFLMSNCVGFSILFYTMLCSFYIKQYVVLN